MASSNQDLGFRYANYESNVLIHIQIHITSASISNQTILTPFLSIRLTPVYADSFNSSLTSQDSF